MLDHSGQQRFRLTATHVAEDMSNSGALALHNSASCLPKPRKKSPSGTRRSIPSRCTQRCSPAALPPVQSKHPAPETGPRQRSP